MCKTIRIATLAALTATVAMLAMTSVASAAAWNASTVYLRMPAKENFGRVSTQKTIRLDAGRYRWNVFLAHRNYPRRPADRPVRHIRLRGGSYRWTDYIRKVPFEAGYEQCSSLDELATRGGPVRLCRAVVGLPPFWKPRDAGTFRFGSRLARVGG